MIATPNTPIDDRVLDGPHGALRVRIYRPEGASGSGLVWLHGGGFFAGDLDMPEADTTSRRLADQGVTVVSVEYRLAPIGRALAQLTGVAERPGALFPVASDDVVFAFRWAEHAGLTAGPWALGGASAGGNLAAGATIAMLRDGGSLPRLLVLAYPTLQAEQDAPGAELRAALDADPAADVFGPESVRVMYENYLGGPVGDTDARAIPGLATTAELEGFPPTVIVNGEVDELRLSGEAFARSLRDAHVDVDLSTEAGTRHGHLNDPASPAAQATVDHFATRLRTLAAG